MEDKAPFEVGEEVICVDGIKDIIQGNRYHVQDIFLCPKCRVWHVALLELPYFGAKGYECAKCDGVFLRKPATHGGATARRFRRIQYDKSAISEILSTYPIREEKEIDVPIKELTPST